MKIFITLFFASLIAFSAAAPAPSEEESNECGSWGPLYVKGTPCPAKNFYSECNSCFCLEDGKSAGCTRMACGQPPLSNGKCA
ncbi:serine protease inhibitor I/II-like isoform X2 [Belonocnema kinseyi]|uniref:serine protease inhibitor I/II-like isoform X2 n=1 Tax=Belonocnema kinseyi TaxID=2817044 RepID=UPI00143DD7D1|nr:serine protease inhibitor I/II-like isoform X2 [Belonocnema kinseyi]